MVFYFCGADLVGGEVCWFAGVEADVLLEDEGVCESGKWN